MNGPGYAGERRVSFAEWCNQQAWKQISCTVLSIDNAAASRRRSVPTTLACTPSEAKHDAIASTRSA